MVLSLFLDFMGRTSMAFGPYAYARKMYWWPLKDLTGNFPGSYQSPAGHPLVQLIVGE